MLTDVIFISPAFFQLALEYGIKFMETSAKANINVENVCSHCTLNYMLNGSYIIIVNMTCICPDSQAFLTLARDIKSKMDTKLVRRTF